MQKKIAVILAATIMAFPVVSFGAVLNDEVTSAKIKEATAGSTSQDTNTGNGVKTGHIVDTAVTTAKIANGAVTDAKIGGTISVGKLPVGTTSTTVAAGNHSHDSVYSGKYANVVVVAASGGDYTSPIAALGSITNASPSNPYLVKVMPGVYDLGTASLQMKEYVDLEGSGPEVTEIKSVNSNTDGGTCTVGTVLMANNMAIRNIKIVNTAPNLNGDYTSVAALVFNNVVAKAEGIWALTGTDTAGGQNNGICTYGPSAHAILNNVIAETHNDGGQSNPLQFMGGKISLTNSRLLGFNTGGSIDVINNNYCNENNLGTLTVMNSTLEATCSTCGIQAITGDGCSFVASVSNSIITLHGNNAVIATQQAFTMENTKIVSDGVTTYNVDPSKTRIAGSLLPGDRTGLVGAKLVNNYDETYTAIPNQ